MTIISLICFLILLLIAISAIHRDADAFSPARIFGAVWFFSIAITDLKFSRLQHEWTILSWIVLWIGVCSLYCGIFISYIISIGSNEYRISEIRARYKNNIINGKALFSWAVTFFLAYSVAFVIETIAFGNLPMFSAYPDRARTSFGLFGFHLFISGGMPVVLVLITEYFVVIPKNYLRKSILALIFVITFVTHAFLLVRYTYMVYILIAMGATYYLSNIIKLRNVIIYLSMFVIAFVFIVQVRETHYIQHYLFVISRMKIPIAFEWITGPYMYIAMNLENFAHAVDQIQHFTYGFYTFDFILAFSGIKHWLAEYSGISTNTYLTSGYNTFPMFFYFFQDFGLFGLFILSLISGFVTGSVYHWMRRSGSLVAIILYGCCFYLIGISFFNNTASYLNFNFTWISLAMVHLTLAPKSTIDIQK